MPDRVGVRVRCLPDGHFRDAAQISWHGACLELDVPGETLPAGSLLEIEQGPVFLWGELQQLNGTTAIVSVEHSLDTSRLQSVREIWGE
jgi:hypothetical protein